MTGQPPARPLYLDTGRESVFGFLHSAGPDTWSGTGVVIVGPWGWDDVVTYRSRREWAEHLAGMGHLSLRIDLPGAGDSGGSAADPQRVEAWTAAVIAGASFVRDLEGCRRVAVVGMGLGGLIAGQAISDGAPIDDLVLWAVPTTGRAFVREARAFSRMQTSRFTSTDEPDPSLLPDGWMEVGGFVLASETVDALALLTLTTIPGGRLRRALLLERDGLPVDNDLKLHLENEGVAVDVAPGDGWAAMCFDIEQYRPPVDVFATVAAWLGSAPGNSSAVANLPPTFRDVAEVAVGSARIRESSFSVEQPFGRTFGVVSEPQAASQSDLCAVFLNAGAVKRTGPNRIWVEAARRYAARGVPSVRLDGEGIGDADGDARQYADVRAFFQPHLGAQVVAALDALEARGLGPRFALIGLCSGAYWAFRLAVDDDRIAAAVLLNPRVLVWDPQLLTRREARAAQKVLQPDSWRRFLRGEIRVTRIARVARATFARAVRVGLAAMTRHLRLGGRASAASAEAALDRLRNKGTSVVLAFSDDEVLGTELQESGLLTRLSQWPNTSYIRLPGRDHTLRPIVAQRALHALLDDVLERELERMAEHG